MNREKTKKRNGLDGSFLAMYIKKLLSIISLSCLLLFLLASLLITQFFPVQQAGIVYANTQTTFRVTEYFIDDDTVNDFTGTTYTLTLDQDLETDYFVFVRGSDGVGTGGGGGRGPDENYIALTGDPFGTGDLATSAASDELDFARPGSLGIWYGVITVVECLVDCENSGFELVDVARISHGDTIASGTDTTTSSWNDLDQVMLVGGFNGAGCENTQTQNGRHNSCWVKFTPSLTNTISWTRLTTPQVRPATSTVMAIEWGEEWTVQRINISGTNGGNGINVVGEYDTGAITSVARDNTWVWGTGTAADNGIGDGSEGVVVTLGDGVTQNANETSIALGSEFTDNKDWQVYALTHPDLLVDYRFLGDGNSGSLTISQTIDSAGAERMALNFNTAGATNNAYPRPIFSARYTTNTNIQLERRRSNVNIAAWIQGIDFTNIQSPEYTQSNWRIYANDNSADVGSPLAAQNTAATLAAFGDPFRLRQLIGFAEASVPISLYNFKLQYALQSGTCDTSFTGETYADVTALTPIAYNNNASPADGDNLTGNANDPTSSNTINDQDYEELNDFTNTVSLIPEGEDGLWDFALIDNTTSAETYCLRVVESDGTVLDIYSQIPEVTTSGFLTVDIVDSGGVSVGSPTVLFSAISVDVTDQTTTGILGISAERIRVQNTTSNAQWSLSIAATGGVTSFWDSAGTDFDFNDPTANANDGGDADSLGGQMTIDPSVATITPEGGCTTTGLTLGSSASFSEGVTDAITLASTSVSADTNCFWDFTDIDISQSIPSEQPAASDYDIDMTVTIVAI